MGNPQCGHPVRPSIVFSFLENVKAAAWADRGCCPAQSRPDARRRPCPSTGPCRRRDGSTATGWPPYRTASCPDPAAGAPLRHRATEGNVRTIDGPKEAIDGSIRANEGSKEAIDGSKEATKGNIETFNGPKMTIKGSKEAIVASIEPNDGPKETIKGSKVTIEGNVGTFDGPKVTIECNVRTINGSKATMKGSKETTTDWTA